MNTSENSSPLSQRMDRRAAIKWMMSAVATAAVLDRDALAARAPRVQPTSIGEFVPTAGGYGSDPDLLKAYKPGDLWPLTFNDQQRSTAAALCDTIVPGDAKGPGAAAVHVEEFIDEWISAPYPGHDQDRKTVLEGLQWIDQEAQKRFRTTFPKLSAAQRNAICDDICYAPNAKAEFKTAAQFFRRYRDLTSGGYYSTPEGMKDIGYTGNVAMEKFEVPKEVLQKLGLA